MTDRKMFNQHLKNVQDLLKRGGFAVEKLAPEVSLENDLKLHPNDYYFLKMDLEKMTNSPVDIDQLYSCRSIRDLVELLPVD